jgi:hypothetical protein
VGLAGGSGVAVLNTSHLQKLLGQEGSDDACSARSRDQAHKNGAATASDLDGHSVGLSDGASPVSTADGGKGNLGIDEGSADGNRHLTGALDTEAEVAILVTNSDNSTEASALSGAGLLLDRGNLQDLILELAGEEVVDNRGLLDGQSVQVDVLDALDLAVCSVSDYEG